MSPGNKGSHFSIFPISILFISLSYLIALARNFSTVLKMSSEKGHPCFVTVLRRKASSFS